MNRSLLLLLCFSWFLHSASLLAQSDPYKTKQVMPNSLKEKLLGKDSYVLRLCRSASELFARDENKAIVAGDLTLPAQIEAAINDWSNEGITPQEIEVLVYGVHRLGSHVKFFQTKKRFLIDENAIRVLMQIVAADLEPFARSLACGLLLKTRRTDWQNVEPELQNLVRVSMERAARGRKGVALTMRLIPFLPLSAAQKAELLSRDLGFSDPERARLGDAEAEKRVMEKFRAAKTFEELKQASEDLGYVGSRECALALIGSLNSPIMREPTIIDKISIRPYIVMALGEIHPENDLLYIEPRRLFNYDDEWDFGGHAKVIEFLQAVNAWAEKTYKVMPRDPFDAASTVWSRPPRP